MTTEFACPKCKSLPNACGDPNKQLDGHHRFTTCMGFICECPTDTDSAHGESLADPCENAQCYHCGWSGQFPPMPKKLKPWQKQALAAGWIPPEGWTA